MGRVLHEDLQASTPEVRIGLSRAGVQGIEKAIRFRHRGVERQIPAEIDCVVDLDPAQKGVHMSRFPELFEEAIDEVVIGEAFLVEVLAEHIATHIVERQQALRAQVRISARYPIERTTPVTGLATQEMVSLMGSRRHRRRKCGDWSGSRRPGSTLARAPRASCAGARASGSSRQASTARTSTGSSSSSRSRRITSAAAGRSSSERRRA
jgi:GTP cyclohydrolase FolE2